MLRHVLCVFDGAHLVLVTGGDEDWCGNFV